MEIFVISFVSSDVPTLAKSVYDAVLDSETRSTPRLDRKANACINNVRGEPQPTCARTGTDRMNRTRRLDIDMDVDGQQTRDSAAFVQDDEQWLRISEQRRQLRTMYLEERRQRRILEQRPEQPRPGSLEANETVARMMAAMGYVPGMTLGKNGHRIVPPPNTGAGAEQDFGEQIEFRAACSALRDLSLIDES